jgi:hypothetical protein
MRFDIDTEPRRVESLSALLWHGETFLSSFLLSLSAHRLPGGRTRKTNYFCREGIRRVDSRKPDNWKTLQLGLFLLHSTKCSRRLDQTSRVHVPGESLECHWTKYSILRCRTNVGTLPNTRFVGFYKLLLSWNSVSSGYHRSLRYNYFREALESLNASPERRQPNMLDFFENSFCIPWTLPLLDIV